jgi:hypothetical protein
MIEDLLPLRTLKELGEMHYTYIGRTYNGLLKFYNLETQNTLVTTKTTDKHYRKVYDIQFEVKK